MKRPGSKKFKIVALSKQFLLVSVLLSLLLSGLASLLPRSPATGTAYANGEQYILYYDKSDANSIKAPLDNTLLVDTLNQTAVFGRGGNFGSTPIGFVYDPTDTKIFQTNGKGNVIYKATYFCSSSGITDNPQDGDIRLTIRASVPFDSSFDTKTVFNGSVSFDSATIQGGARNGEALGVQQVPAKCLPNGINQAGPTRSVQFANYSKITDSTVRARWPGVKDSAALAALPDSTGGDGADNEDSAPSCEASGFSLSWILCPIIEGAASAVDGIYENIIEPLLETDPVNLSNPEDDPTHLYSIWSNFRLYGDIFLVIALLVIVFGESIGGGVIDAYAVKKILPRLLVAAVAINLSIYIVAFAVDFTNILGKGVAALLQAPFKDAIDNSSAYTIKIGGATGDLGMAALVGGGIWAALSLGPLLEFLLLMVMIPAFLTFLGIMAIVLLRSGLIILLIIVAPVAFALYCLPNTEQYFRRWWELLFKTLLIYPLIAVFFALGNVLSVTINSTASGVTGSMTALLSVVALFAPLFLIPFSFRIAGGLIGRLQELAASTSKRSSEAIKGNVNDQNSWRNMVRRKLSNRSLAQRENIVSRGQNMQVNNRSRLSRMVGGGMATVAGLGSFQQKRSIKNKEASDWVQTQVATGNDSTVRAMFARKLRYKDGNDQIQEGYFGTGAKVGADGLVEGANKPQFSDYEVSKARSVFGHDASFYQAALTYEIGKAGDDNELDTIRQVNADNIKNSPWLRQESVGIVKGSGFSHQQTRRELKHENLDVNKQPAEFTRDSAKFTREVSETVSNWGLSNMRTSTLVALQDDYNAAQAYKVLNDDNATPAAKQNAQATINKIVTERKVQPKISSVQDADDIIKHVESTAQSLEFRQRAGGQMALQGEGSDQSVVSGSQTGAPGHVNEQIENLIKLTAPGRAARQQQQQQGSSGGTTT